MFCDTGTMNMFDMCDYMTAAHYDKGDLHSTKTIAVFIEEHHPGCSCTRCAWRWRFFCPELRWYVSVHHGTIIVWDSARLLHGTTVHSQPCADACRFSVSNSFYVCITSFMCVLLIACVLN